MPWRWKARKDAASCENSGGAARRRYYPGVSEWGNPAGQTPVTGGGETSAAGANPEK